MTSYDCVRQFRCCLATRGRLLFQYSYRAYVAVLRAPAELAAKPVIGWATTQVARPRPVVVGRLGAPDLRRSTRKRIAFPPDSNLLIDGSDVIIKKKPSDSAVPQLYLYKDTKSELSSEQSKRKREERKRELWPNFYLFHTRASPVENVSKYVCIHVKLGRNDVI